MKEYHQESIKLRKELSKYDKPSDVIDAYILSLSKNLDIMSSYPTMTLFLFDKNNTITDEDQFKDSFVIDYRVQWIDNPTCLFSDSPNGLEEMHYLQYHLYLYFKSNCPHAPSKLATFELKSVNDIEKSLSEIRQFSLKLQKEIEENEYLGHFLVFTDAL